MVFFGKIKLIIISLVIGLISGAVGGIFLFDMTVTHSSVTHHSLGKIMSDNPNTPVVILDSEFIFDISLVAANWDNSEELFTISLNQNPGVVLDTQIVTLNELDYSYTGGDQAIIYRYSFAEEMTDKTVYELSICYTELVYVPNEGIGDVGGEYVSVDKQLDYYFMFVETDLTWFMENALFLYNLSVLNPAAFYLLPLGCLFIIISFILLGVKYKEYSKEMGY